SAYVGYDRPPIGNRHLMPVSGHRTHPARNHIEQVTVLDAAEALFVKRRRRREPVPSRGDDPISIAGTTVAGCAEDVEAILSSKNQLARSGHRKALHVGAILGAAIVEASVFPEGAASDRSGYRHAHRAIVGIKYVLVLRIVPQLVVHIPVEVDRRIAAPRSATAHPHQSRDQYEKGMLHRATKDSGVGRDVRPWVLELVRVIMLKIVIVARGSARYCIHPAPPATLSSDPDRSVSHLLR